MPDPTPEQILRTNNIALQSFLQDYERRVGTINGQQTRIVVDDSDAFERSLLNMMGIRNITETYPARTSYLASTMTPGRMLIRLQGLSADDTAALVTAMNTRYGAGTATEVTGADARTENRNRDVPANVRFVAFPIETASARLAPDLHQHLSQTVARDNPGLIRLFQTQARVAASFTGANEQADPARSNNVGALVPRLQEFLGDGAIVQNVTNPANTVAIHISNNTLADTAIDRLVTVRNAAGLNAEQMGFRISEDGNILVVIPNADAVFTALNRNPQTRTDFRRIASETVQESQRIARLASFTPAQPIQFLPAEPAQDVNFVEGNLQLPENIRDAALQAARNLREQMRQQGITNPAQTVQLAPIAGLNGNNNDVTDQELAAYLVARAMSQPVIPPGRPVQVTFNNTLSANDYTTPPRDPALIFQMARQILGDTWGAAAAGGVDTTTEAGNRPYIEGATNSPTTSRQRC